MKKHTVKTEKFEHESGVSISAVMINDRPVSGYIEIVRDETKKSAQQVTIPLFDFASELILDLDEEGICLGIEVI